MKTSFRYALLGFCAAIAAITACKTDDLGDEDDEDGTSSSSSSGQQSTSSSTSSSSGSSTSSSSGSSTSSSSGSSSGSTSSSGGSDAGSDAGASGTSFVITGGTFDDVDLDVVDGAASFFDVDSEQGVETRLILYVTNRAGLCGTGPRRQGAQLFFIDALSGETPFATGTFTQQQDDVPGNVSGGFGVLSDTCSVTADYGATEATVVISEITDTSVKGTFDLTFENDLDTLQGTFEVPICGTPFDSTCRP